MNREHGGLHHVGRVLGIVALFFAASAALAAVSASAARVHPYQSSFSLPPAEAGDGSHLAGGVAINQTTHHVYVADLFGNQIDNFDSGGQLDPVTPKLTGAVIDPFDVAVDNSGTSTGGYLYATDLSGFVQQYSPAGHATSVRITEAAIPADGIPQSGGLDPVVNDGTFTPVAVAVDSEGHVFVSDTRGNKPTNTIDEFSPSGTFIAQLKNEIVGGINLFAISASGDIYGATDGGLRKLDPSGHCIDSCEPIGSTDSTFGVTIDASSGNILVTYGQGEFNEYDSSGMLVSRSVGGGSTGIAIDESSQKVYVGSSDKVKIFGPLLTLADPITGEATALTSSVATLNGTVDPSGVPLDECYFEYGETNVYERIAPCENPDAGEVGSGSGPVPVHAEVSDLVTGTEYHFRLIVVNANAPSEPQGKDETFTTLGPQLRSETVSNITTTSLELEGVVNPAGLETSYIFQYVSETAFLQSGYAEAITAPVGGGTIPASNKDASISQEIDGLAPSTTYYVRLIATNAEGTATSANKILATYELAPSFSGCPNEALRLGFSGGLPDCRAYEQATPVDKNAVNAGGERNSIETAVDGGRNTFFAEASMPGGEGAQDLSLFLASRDGDGTGWSSQGLFPPANLGPEAEILGLSEDLSHAYVLGAQFSAPATLYDRNNADHSLRVIATLEGRVSFADATANGSSMIFEAEKSASFKASEHAPASGPSVYLWDATNGTVALASVLNNGQAPPEGAFGGPYDWGQPSLAVGGAAQSYNTVLQHALSDDGESLFFTAAGSGRLYLRRHLLQPQSPRNGQGKCTDPAKACTIEVSASTRPVADPDGLEPAAFMEATPDGSFVFFTSPSELTQDATTGSADQGNDLYRYDAASEELTDLAPDQADPNGAEVMGVLGSGADGSSVYFVANGVLAANEGADGSHAAPGDCVQPESSALPKGQCNAYLWTVGTGGGSGQIKFIARLDAPADYEAWRHHSFGPAAPDGAKPAAVSSGGGILLLRSKEKLTAYDNEGVSELYRYRSATGEIDCVSCNPTGAAPAGPPLLNSLATLQGVGGPAFPLATRNLSRNGDRVFFETPDALVAADSNGAGGCPLVNGRQSCLDVYEWEADGAGSCESELQDGGCLYLLSGGNTSDPSYFGGASASGDDVSIFTAQPLVNQDKDQLVDVYDARVGGGIAAQNSVPPIPCEGEACKGEAGGATPAPSPGSATFSGPGNPKSPSHHKKKHHQKKHKKKHHQKKTKKHGHRSAHR